jgi:hypothetical protein
MAGMPPAEIVTEQVIILDWHDGPLEGFLRTKVPKATWYFKVIAARTSSDMPDDRLFLFSEAPGDSLERLTAVLKDDDNPTSPLWVPAWHFEKAETKQRADAVLAEIMSLAQHGQLIVRSTDMRHIRDVWPLTTDIATRD